MNAGVEKGRNTEMRFLMVLVQREYAPASGSSKHRGNE